MRYLSLALLTAALFGFVAFSVVGDIHSDLKMQINSVVCVMMAIPLCFLYLAECNIDAAQKF